MIPDKVKHQLNALGLAALEFEAGSTPTSAAAAERIGVEVGQIAKSMLLKSKDDRYFLVVIPGNRKLSNGKLKAVLGVKTRMATPEETEEATGYRPGGVCPFGIDPIPVFVDDALAQYDKIYPAAGTDASGVPMTFNQLVRVTGASVAELSAPRAPAA